RRISDRTAVSQFLASCRPQWQSKPQLVRLNNVVHVAAFAPVGAGKSSGLVLPWLLTNPDSCVIVDFKGELAEKSAEARRRLGHKVVLLDPFGALSQREDQPLYHWPKDTFNPMDWIDGQREQMIDECRDLAESLVLRTGEEKDPHWNDRAEQN